MENQLKTCFGSFACWNKRTAIPYSDANLILCEITNLSGGDRIPVNQITIYGVMLYECNDE